VFFGRDGLGIFFLHSFIHLFPVNSGGLGNHDAQFDLFAAYAKHGDFDVVADVQAFAGPPCQYEHEDPLLRCRWGLRGSSPDSSALSWMKT
jgi:hypothetical protein